jgi:hypothetical protein
VSITQQKSEVTVKLTEALSIRPWAGGPNKAAAIVEALVRCARNFDQPSGIREPSQDSAALSVEPSSAEHNRQGVA